MTGNTAVLKRLAIVGAGFMARRRARAFLATGQARICAVASRRLAPARTLASEVGCPEAFDDYREILATGPEAVLVEVPHAVQDEIVAWALDAGLHVLIGGPLSRSLAGGEAILAASRKHGLVVEAGYEARYKAVWLAAREAIARGEIGRPVCARAIGLWDGKPESWYYDQSASGGMPLTHMTYVFLNPLRWLFGEPSHVSAFANRIRHTAPERVTEETCAVNLLFPEDVLGSLLAGYVDPGDDDGWSVSLLGTQGVLKVYPTEMDNGRLRLLRGSEVSTTDFGPARDAFEVQAEAFLAAVRGEGETCRNRPEDCLGDLRVAEAVAASAREKRTIALAPDPEGFSAAPT